jgi:hypothetical protein
MFRCLRYSHGSAVLQLLIGTESSREAIIELQTQIRDYSQLITDPLCPCEMRDLLVLEMGQIITALILNADQLSCELCVVSNR